MEEKSLEESGAEYYLKINKAQFKETLKWKDRKLKKKYRFFLP